MKAFEALIKMLYHKSFYYQHSIISNTVKVYWRLEKIGGWCGPHQMLYHSKKNSDKTQYERRRRLYAVHLWVDQLITVQSDYQKIFQHQKIEIPQR